MEVMPEFDLFPKVKKLGEFLFRLCTPFHSSTEDYMSDHNFDRFDPLEVSDETSFS